MYSGAKLPPEKRDSTVNGVVIPNSGVANYLLEVEGASSAQEVFDLLVPVTEEGLKDHRLYVVLVGVTAWGDEEGLWKSNESCRFLAAHLAEDEHSNQPYIIDGKLERTVGRMLEIMNNRLEARSLVR